MNGVEKSICEFLADYAAYMLGCGATCIRIEKNVGRIAEAFGVQTELVVMPAHVHLTVSDSSGQTYGVMRRIRSRGISFNVNTQLSQLSLEVAEGKMEIEEARRRMHSIVETPHSNPWWVLLSVSLANASFCRLFGGDIPAMAMVFFATLLGYKVKQELLRKSVNVGVVFFCSAFFSSVVASGGTLFGWGETPDVALGTSVLYLIPGVPYISSMSDLLGKHYVCATSRFLDALVLTVCLSLGLCGGFIVMGLKIF